MESFAGAEIAAGYARARPPVHERVIARVAESRGWPGYVGTVLDVGCGAGASTRAMQPWAARVIGIDPVGTMLAAGRSVAADALLVTGRAEALPIADRAIDLITAAGSLNFVDLDGFASEASRVLRAERSVLVYDFATGRASPAVPRLAATYDEFARRWPRPVGNRRAIDPAALRAHGFDVLSHEEFVVTIEMDSVAYVEYLMTETNVAAAVARGERRDAIRTWLATNVASIRATEIPIDFASAYVVARPVS